MNEYLKLCRIFKHKTYSLLSLSLLLHCFLPSFFRLSLFSISLFCTLPPPAFLFVLHTSAMSRQDGHLSVASRFDSTKILHEEQFG